MFKEEDYAKIHLEVLSKIRPKTEERERLESEYTSIKEKISSILDKEGINAKIELCGSFSRDTWLSGNRDLDIFIKLPYGSLIEPDRIIKIVKKGIDLPWQKKHANHPYLYSKKDDFEIEIIPCYEIENGMRVRSPVDRSPLHKKFIVKNLPAGANDEVRLLKQFMRGVETYGAEIKVHGFSGYLVELLIIYNDGKFLEALKNIKNLPGKIVKFNNEEVCNNKKFENEPLIVLDPTDKYRNVASAVKQQALNEFIAAAENYLRNPSINYFFPKKIIMNASRIEEIRKSDLCIISMIHKKPAIVDDILWGQLRKFERSINNHLSSEGFRIIKINSIDIDEKIITTIVCEDQYVDKYQWNQGPPVDNPEQEKFLTKYLTNNSVIYGPTIIEDKWAVLIKREKISIENSILFAIEKNLISLPSHLQLKKKEMKFMNKEALLQTFPQNETVLRFIYKMMKGKPSYLE